MARGRKPKSKAPVDPLDTLTPEQYEAWRQKQAQPKSKKEDFIGPPVYPHRYVVSIQKIDDPCCFIDDSEGDVLKDMKDKAVKLNHKHQRSVIVWDREHWIYHTDGPFVFTVPDMKNANSSS